MRHARIATTIDIYGGHAQDEVADSAVRSLQAPDEVERTLEQQVAALTSQVAELMARQGQT